MADKSSLVRTWHLSEVHQQPTLHVKTPWANACIISLLHHVYCSDLRKVRLCEISYVLGVPARG